MNTRVSALLRRTTGRLAVGGLLVSAPFALMAAVTSPATAGAPVRGAVSTTTNVHATTGNGACLNGGPGAPLEDPTNCNIYSSKEDVWLSGLPNSAALGTGTYFFSVMVPGGQADPNDGAEKNLSDITDAPYSAGSTNSDGSAIPSGDLYTNRTFSIDGSGIITYSGSHNFQNNEIQLFPYDDTTNPGGVYIMGVCKIDGANSYPVNPSDCKYDAFKVQKADQPVAKPLTVTKDATGTYTTTYKWDIAKSVDKARVEQLGGTVTSNYTVTVHHDDGTISNVKVTGTINVFNPNTGSVSGVDVVDQLSDGTVCPVTGGSQATVVTGDNFFPYTCSLGSKPRGQLDNTVTATWGDQVVDPDGSLAAGSANFTFSSIDFTETRIDNCATVTDSYGLHGAAPKTTTLGTVCVGDANPTSFTYSHTVYVPTYAKPCVTYDNTAKFKTNTTGTTGSSSVVSVTVCGSVKTKAHFLGYWKNSTGQGIIKAGSSTGGVCNSGTWLRGYAPFGNLSATANCTDVATYALNAMKAAGTCGPSSCNTMLKAQMLTTALNVYFSDAALGGNAILAPKPIGGVAIDLTYVCHMIDGSFGTSTCSNTFVDASSAFGPASSLTVSQMLAFAASQSNVDGSVWYGQVQATQLLAKDAFDAINHQVAFGAP